MDMSIWESYCTFADPFNSFGVDPISKATGVDIIHQPTADECEISWTFSSKLKLPWKPILAASGDESHYNSRKSDRICCYEERWKSKPIDQATLHKILITNIKGTYNRRRRN